MRAAIAAAVEFDAGHLRDQGFDFIVAVDRGFAHLQAAGIAPQLVLGDFDSLGFVPEGPDVRSFNPEKDASDTQLACEAALDRGCDELVLYGCLGQRLDHTLANLQVMAGLARRGVRVYAVGEDSAVAVLHAGGAPVRLQFAAMDPSLFPETGQGRFISVFAKGGAAHGVTMQGLKYPLDGVTLDDCSSLGLSNEFTGEPALVQVEEGGLVVVFPLLAWEYMLDGDGSRHYR